MEWVGDIEEREEAELENVVVLKEGDENGLTDLKRERVGLSDLVLHTDGVRMGVEEYVVAVVVVTLREKERVGERVWEEDELWDVEELGVPLWDGEAEVDMDTRAVLDIELKKVGVVKGEVVAKFVDTMGVAVNDKDKESVGEREPVTLLLWDTVKEVEVVMDWVVDMDRDRVREGEVDGVELHVGWCTSPGDVQN